MALKDTVQKASSGDLFPELTSEERTYLNGWAEGYKEARNSAPTDTDAISRKAVELALTADITDMSIEDYIGLVSERIKAIPAMPTDSDTISRAKVIAEAKKAEQYHLANKELVTAEAFCMFAEAINSLPTVQPEQKKGKWLPLIEADENGEPYQSGVYCSECGCRQTHIPKFCEECGADMKGNNNDKTE